MQSKEHMDLVHRFVQLPLPQRKLFFQKLESKGMSLAQLPIPELRAGQLSLPVSYAQQRQWFLWQLEPLSAAYHIPTALRLKGFLDIEALHRSFVALIQRHESLRTTFRQDGAQVVQIVHSDLPFELDHDELPGQDEIALRDCIEAEIQRAFDLEAGPLLRVKLLRLTAGEHVLVLTLHHIVTDGWSMPIIVDELLQLYEGYSTGIEAQLPALPIQYADYAVWQRSWMEAGELERQLGFWAKELGGEQPVLELPTDRPYPAVRSHAGASLGFDLDPELSLSLKQLAQRQGVTLFMVLLASFQALLYRYSGQHDIRVGVPIANRNRVETARLIGFFVNTQVLKAEFDSHPSFSELLQQVRQRVVAAQAHQDLPFEQLVDALQPERSLSRSPLFQVMYNHQTAVKGSGWKLPGLTLEGVSWEHQTAQFDLSLNTLEDEHRVGASLTYCTALFDKTTMERLRQHWINLLKGIVRQPEQRIAELSLLNAEEFQQIVHGWNRTEADYPRDRCIHQLIDAQVELAPEAVALVFDEHSLSYGELNRRANRLAHRLRELGVGPDVLVGIAVERSLEMVVGLLGILKAGGAYVPLDPEYPQDRLAYMLEDSGIRLLLTQPHLTQALPIPEGVDCLELEAGEDWLAGYDEGNPPNLAMPESLAYVIYTSGSTGRPKGAGNTHRALMNRLWWMQKAYQLGAADSVLQKTPFSFDVSVWEFFWPLLSGSRLVVAQPSEHRDPERLIDTINRHGVTTLHFVPSMLQAFMASERVDSCLSIRRVVCSGEALSTELAFQVRHKLPGAGLFNLYGPTEAAIDVTHWTCDKEEGAGVPIGQPIDNLKTYVLEGGLLPAVGGGAGELYLGGVGLARGYHARPALTAERFVPDPFGEPGGSRLYRTGDLARYRVDGVIDYLGRLDHQVKIRGFRIELGEIEACLLEQEEVREAVVLARDGTNGKQLVGYIVPLAELSDEGQKALCDRLKSALKAGLPAHMVPAHLMFLARLPVTPNGKLDRKVLPEPDLSYPSQAYVAPRTELEQQIAVIWEQVLKVNRVGLTDHFFELGGNSLLAVKLVADINKHITKDIRLHDLLANQTLEALVGYIREGLQKLSTPLVALNQCTADRTPLFCLPPAGGSSYPYYPLAMRLRGQRPVYGLMCRTFVDHDWIDESWSGIVEDYLSCIRTRQPQGPYLLLGWSLGGALAQEIARALERDGQSVAFLGLVDSTPTVDVVVEAMSTKETLPEHVSTVALSEVEKEGLEWINAFFGELGGEAIEEEFFKAKRLGLVDRQAVEAVLSWATDKLNLPANILSGVMADFSLGAEISQGYAIEERYKLLFKDFKKGDYQVRPSCWWAMDRHEAYMDAREKVVSECALNGMERSVRLVTTHGKIITSADFISDLEVALQDAP